MSSESPTIAAYLVYFLILDIFMFPVLCCVGCSVILNNFHTFILIYILLYLLYLYYTELLIKCCDHEGGKTVRSDWPLRYDQALSVDCLSHSDAV